MLTDKMMRHRMESGWRAGRPFTACGNGSLPEHTENIRTWLPGLCERLAIRSINDAGAGDLQWSVGIDWDVDYLPFDLIPRDPRVLECDITRQVMPRADAILCRMVLNHLADDPRRISTALQNFEESGARYLIATQFDPPFDNRTRQFQRLDLTERLGPYIDFAKDGNEPNCKLAVWEL